MKKEWIDLNVNEIFEKYKVPQEFDLLSIDIDGMDYWVWQALEYEPRIVIIEYNTNFPHGEIKILKYAPGHRWTKDVAYSASFEAMRLLGEEKGYDLVQAERHNLFFIKKGLVDPPEVRPTLPQRVHKQTGYDRFQNERHINGI